MTKLYKDAFENLQEAWENVIDIEPELHNFEINP